MHQLSSRSALVLVTLKRAILTVHQQLRAGLDLLLSDAVQGPADVESLVARLDGCDPEDQPGSRGGNQRPVAGRGPAEAPGEWPGRAGGSGAVEGDVGTPGHEEGAVREGGGRADGCGQILWTA